MIRRRLANAHGFTLVEAILSLVVLGVALVPLMNLFAYGAERNHLPYQVVAAGLAAYKMEEVIAARALAGWETFTGSPLNAYGSVDTTNFPGYQWKVTIDRVQPGNFDATSGNSRFKKITVSVVRTGEPEFTLSTMVTDY